MYTPLPYTITISFFFFFFFFINVCISPSRADYSYLSECSTNGYSCGSITDITYPFWVDTQPDFCGHQRFKLTCQNKTYPTILIEKLEFRILNINQSHNTMTMVRDDMWNSTCPHKFTNTTMDNHFYTYTSEVHDLTLFYGCSRLYPVPIPIRHNFTCEVNGIVGDAFYAMDSFDPVTIPDIEQCNVSIRVPVFREALDELRDENLTLVETLNHGFDVDYNIDEVKWCYICKNTGGICGSSNTSSMEFACLCPDEIPFDVFYHGCDASAPEDWRAVVVIGVFAALCLIGAPVIAVYLCIRKDLSAYKLYPIWKRISNGDILIEVFIKNFGFSGPKRYSYAEIKKMTNSFKDKLGQGGFGEVFKGTLSDGTLVAVKVLNASKGNGQEFINEVDTISRTSHVNIVTLLGFCFESRRKALIYEFMANGSLEKFLYSENPPNNCRFLGCEKLYQIAVGIARGLEYLHRGCNTRIFHFDIKPHNILLDEDFCPKIADFGLAKLCRKKESKFSHLEPRGTPGYVAPEVFSRSYGPVSHKSDVYSYGMMVLEMVGGTKDIEIQGDSSEIYFPHWIYKRLLLNKDLGLLGVVDKEENDLGKKMVLTGLWCIQNDPSHRPSITKVIEMLEGSIDALQIPPTPFSSSPPRSPPTTATTSTTSH